MNDTKNILLAWASSTSTIFAAFEGVAWISVVSAVVLPIIFFAIGKTIDVLLQIHFRNADLRNAEARASTRAVQATEEKSRENRLE